MMTIHRISAGDGYEYYTKEVASADVRRKRDQQLGDYYLKSGAPAGVWEGTAITKHFGISGTVTEQQMRDLFGQGKRPDAQAIRDAKHGVVNERDLILGRAYATYPAFREQFRTRVAEQVRLFTQANDRKPVGKELSDIRFGVARTMYVEDRRRQPLSDAEVGRFLNAQLDKQTGSVAGFDLTFSAPKSVSVLWALGDEHVRELVEDAHTQAIRDTITWLERDVISSRAGLNGVRRAATDGIMAARFRHYDSRAGDPQLHDHLVVSNKVYCPDLAHPNGGVWRTIDGRVLYRAVVASSERYNNALMHRLNEALDISFEARTVAGTGTPKMEISFISDDLIDQFSSRRTTIKHELDKLEAAYIRDHGHAPSRKARIALAQKATLATRQNKDHASLGQRMADWHAQTAARFPLDTVRRAAGAIGVPVSAPADEILAATVIVELEKRRSTWTRRHVQAEAARVIANATGGRDVAPDRIDLLTQRVLTDSGLVRLARPAAPLADALTDADGVSLYDRPDTWRYTSPAIIDREASLLDLTERTLTPAATPDTLATILEAARADGVKLGADKQVMIDVLALSDRALVTAVGPAGTGKTTAMRYVARAARADGHTVVGLAPSAVAAKELGDSLSIEASTAQRWLTREAWRDLKAGDMVIIDEAAMMDTATLADVATMATSQGAVVRMVGDPYQLRAVEAGGAFEMLHDATAGPELAEVFRFHDDAEARASLNLRRGTHPFTWYTQHDRIHGGSPEEATAAAFAAWCNDSDAGHTSIIMASTADTVSALNDAIATHRASAGETTPAPHTITTRDGHTLRIGDTVLTRRNDTSNPYGRGSFVKNGDLFTLTATHADGSLTVTARDGSVLTLSADYTRKHVQLGYAVTVHRAQGVTVDSAHAVLDSSASREAAYVALTRGRSSNQLWVALDDDQPIQAALDAIATRTEDDVAAHTAALQDKEAAADPRTARDVYLDLVEQADKARWATRLREAAANGSLPESLADPTGSRRWANLVGKLSAAEEAGLNVDKMLSTVTADMGEPRDAVSLTSWRLERWMNDHPEILTPTPTSLAHLSDAELASATQDAHAQADQLLRRLHTLSSSSHIHLEPGTAPAWALRPYGHLSDTALTNALSRATEDVFLLDGAPDPTAAKDAADRVATLQAERDLRATMPEAVRRVEDDQRDAVARLPFDERISATTRLLAGPYTPVRPYDTVETTVAHLVDDTRAALARARETATQAATEQLRRTYRTSAATSRPDDTLSTWAAPAAALTDPATPDQLRDALTTQRERLAANTETAGATALKDANWARGLTKPETLTEQRWHTLIGEVATYRATHAVDDTIPLHEVASTGAPGEKPIHDQVTYLALQQAKPAPEALQRAQADADQQGIAVDQVRDGRALPVPPDPPQQTADTTEARAPQPEAERPAGWAYRTAMREAWQAQQGADKAVATTTRDIRPTPDNMPLMPKQPPTPAPAPRPTLRGPALR